MTPSSVYIVTEKCEVSVAVVERAPQGVTPSSARSVVVGAMNALAHLHRLGFCHLNLHPGSILIAANDVPVSIQPSDVRLSFFENAQKQAPDTTPFFGKTGVSGYRAPEAIVGAIPYDGPSADTYSMGCIALELILGRETFKKSWLDVKDQSRTLRHWGDAVPSRAEENATSDEGHAAEHGIQQDDRWLLPHTLEEFATDYVPAMLEQEREAIGRAPGALEFLSSTLDVNPAERQTAEELLHATWFTHRTTRQQHLQKQQQQQQQHQQQKQQQQQQQQRREEQQPRGEQSSEGVLRSKFRRRGDAEEVGSRENILLSSPPEPAEVAPRRRSRRTVESKKVFCCVM